MGRYQAALIDKIRQLENNPVELPKPTITMGVLEPPQQLNETDAPVGLVETKTPQRIEFEVEQETERQGLS